VVIACDCRSRGPVFESRWGLFFLSKKSFSVFTFMPRATTSIASSCRGLSRRQLHQASKGHPPVHITTLPNKIRVATESKPGHFSSVGLYIDAGSRYETPLTSGASHFLDRMAFKVLSPYLFPYSISVRISVHPVRPRALVHSRRCRPQLTPWAVR
jgi:hypothetical protein